jgi:hypothetical protein
MTTRYRRCIPPKNIHRPREPANGDRRVSSPGSGGARLDSTPPGRYTPGMSAVRRSDTKVLVIATIAVIVGGLVIAAAILLVSGRAKTPALLTKPVPFGVAKGMKQTISDGGPVAFAGTTGDTGFWLALEDGKLVALQVKRPGTKDCNVRWKGSVDSFVDCNGNKVRIDQLARFPIEIPTKGPHKGQLLVDLRHTDPPPNPS